MTLRIDTSEEGSITLLRLLGQIGSEHLDELSLQIANAPEQVAFDMEDVTLVDIETVRFLAACQESGVQLRNCPPYIREWILRECGNPADVPYVHPAWRARFR